MASAMVEEAQMSSIFRYDKPHESELIALLKSEPDWNSFTGPDSISGFKKSLLSSETYVYKVESKICGYLRALVDEFGIYVSELYISPSYRNNGYGTELLKRIQQEHPNQDVYVLSDEDLYYESLGCKCVGSVFRL
jgi:ribosomal protein S18 acetylase RimI-like enzyme